MKPWHAIWLVGCISTSANEEFAEGIAIDPEGIYFSASEPVLRILARRGATVWRIPIIQDPEDALQQVNRAALVLDLMSKYYDSKVIAMPDCGRNSKLELGVAAAADCTIVAAANLKRVKRVDDRKVRKTTKL